MQHRQITEQAWASLKPLLTQAKQTSDDSWIHHYIPGMAETEQYFYGSLDRFSLLLAIISRHLAAGARILDAGAGYGIQPAVFKQAGFDAYASDIYESLAVYEPLDIAYARWNLEAEAAPYADAFFDAVVLSQTIEHFTYSPKKPLEEILRIIKPGGWLLIDAPNISSFHNISRLIRGKSVHWSLKTHYLQQEPFITDGIPYYDRHNHEYCMQDFLDIADFFNLSIQQKGYYSPVNRQTKSALSIAVSRVRDIVPHWRKGLYCLYQK
ncbi:MAG: hypothetical protein CO186_08735 [Zetaproteobacteria bacterium CG_4_9_14_3_um_filter_49_83]|nr:MAG: hypothetical protein AUJ56_04280 [Zetaproteobacteria bacterium CG1_02_49_23]PIQ31628.1 MAG: hypothetical protein COW62_09080 [Zetaproteobacteria bacterium CG17_big_fil_post_rev_8_21_14_2_50_50_13]PIV30039.1 MAG: hypothetical protein COS35_08745 [Zetaproteobacteria bacterium CG02_land_8_20_14_3_00_50_9]PIY55494.1 MAG: hypothetical protein COZ00_08985 [Zetaproteobacteria bacterium CG_4_10_14_0_8_um_filter_49_80]PJA34850.1 MAG: hypothetical protein CO186_08735 [Zetaproteobacteria bacterium